MKLAMIRIIAHHTSGEAKPLIPVHDHALSRSAVSVAPRFKRSSDTRTHTTLNASCSQGLPKPEGRSCIVFLNCHRILATDFDPSQKCAPSKLVGVWKPLQDRIVPRRAEIFDGTAEGRVKKRGRVDDIKIKRHELAVEMQLWFII
jgi:hypothetical protein